MSTEKPEPCSGLYFDDPDAGPRSCDKRKGCCREGCPTRAEGMLLLAQATDLGAGLAAALEYDEIAARFEARCRRSRAEGRDRRESVRRNIEGEEACASIIRSGAIPCPGGCGWLLAYAGQPHACTDR